MRLCVLSFKERLCLVDMSPVSLTSTFDDTHQTSRQDILKRATLALGVCFLLYSL